PHMRDRDGTKFRLDLRGAALTLDDLAQLSESPFAMDAGELTTLRTVIQTTGRETLEKFIEILFKVNLADEASTAERAGRIVGLFDRIAELLLEGGRIGELERLLRKVRLLTGPRGKPLPENQVAIDHIFAHWSNAAFVERITGPLADPNYRFTPSVLAICGLLDARVVPALARAAGVVGTAEARAHLLALVAHRLPGHERAVAELLREVSPALAHDLVRILAPRVERTVVPFMVRAAMGNPDPTVRLEGLSLLPLDQLERHLTLLFPALHDPAKAVRSKAIHLIARVQSPDVHRRILQSIDDKAFTDFELDEKRRYFAAAALTGDANARFLELFQSGGLITRKGQDELRHCAAVALAIRLQRDAAALFDKELKRRIRSDVVAEAAEWAMQHMQCDRAERTRQLYDLFFRGVLVRGEGEVSA
ncbi:MAG: HEAT repeat domain-containing protein, partial [Myxococcales bacterium]|nr:HEAT repeat domain-containing protein [Myxococcales bacterium]